MMIGYDHHQPYTLHSEQKSMQPLHSFLFLSTVLALVGLGLIMMYSASYNDALRRGLPGAYFFLRQGLYALLGLAAFVVIQWTPMRLIRALVPVMVLGALVLMVLTLITPLGLTRSGSRRWIQIGPLPAFQSSELLRVVVVMALSDWFSRQTAAKQPLKSLLLPTLLVGVSAFLILAQRDYSTMLLFLITAVILYIAFEVPIRYLLLFVIPGVVGTLIFLLIEPYRVQRLAAFIFPKADPSGLNWQVGNSLKAISAGGWWGRGLGQGTYKLGLLPEVQNDFIFSSILEELGLIGALIIFLLFFFFAYIPFRYYLQQEGRQSFEGGLLFGFTTSICYQVMVNIAVCTGLLPPTGITLPFFSQGGTSLIVVICQCAVLYKIIVHHSEYLYKERHNG